MISNMMTNALRPALLLLLFAGMMQGCAPQISPPATIVNSKAPVDFPDTYYHQAEASGTKILRIDTERSLVVIQVRRGGTLARLGHDHVVASHDVAGYADMKAGRADLYVPLERLSVDEAGLRAEVGLSAQISTEAIEATRRNMLDKVLVTGRYPFALIHVARETPDSPILRVTITLHDTTQSFDVPAQIETVAGGIKISGQLAFKQSDFGITPFSILGGAMQVQDKLDLRFRIFATASP